MCSNKNWQTGVIFRLKHNKIQYTAKLNNRNDHLQKNMMFNILILRRNLLVSIKALIRMVTFSL